MERKKRNSKKSNVHASMYHNVQKKGFVSVVDVLIDTRMLSAQDYQNWRIGGISCLEGVCKGNNRKITEILQEMKTYAIANKLKTSITVYNGWGRHKGEKLRFTKSNSESIERIYSTHFVETKDSKNYVEKKKKNPVEGGK
jgi:hypothetical protein